MSYFLKMIKWMGIKKHNITVVSISAAIAISIYFFQGKSRRFSPWKSRVYSIADGWGYDILVKDSLFIHQESVPALEGNKPFGSKAQAIEAANQLISKLKKGESPSFSRSEIEHIMLAQ